MKYKITTLETVYDDLKEIKKYLAQFYPSMVRKFIDLYKKQRERLKEFPHSCQAYEDNPCYRKQVVGDYLVFYIADDEKETVEIHRILHGSKDIKKL